MLKRSKMQKTLLDQNVTNRNGYIFCHNCVSEIKSKKDAFLHLSEKQHQTSKQNEAIDILLDNIEEVYKLLKDNQIEIAVAHNFMCIPCQQSFEDDSAILQHIESNNHIISFKKCNADMYCDNNKVDMSFIRSRCKSKEKIIHTFELKKEYLNVLLKDKDILNSQEQEALVSLKYNMSPLDNYTEQFCKTLVCNAVVLIEYHKLICSLCNYLVRGDVRLHVIGERHIHNLKGISEESDECDIIEIQPDIHSNSKETQKLELLEIDGASVISLNKLDNWEMLKDQRILQLESGNLMCELCMCSIPTTDHIMQHINGKQHANSLMRKSTMLQSKETTTECINVNSKMNIREVELNVVDIKNLNTNQKLESCNNYVKDTHQRLVDNEIAVTEDSVLRCTYCTRKFPSLHDFLSHIKGKSHKNMLKELQVNLNTNDSKYIKHKNSSTNESTNKQSTESLQNEVNIKKKQNQDLNNITNNIHNIVVTSKLQDNIHNNILEDYCHYCELCNEQIDINNLFEHINTVTHKCNIFTMSMGDDIILFQCLCCKSIIQGNTLLLKHWHLETHLNNLVKYLKCIQTENKKIRLCNVLFPKMENGSMYFHKICLIFVHIKDVDLCSNKKNNIPYHCSICCANLESVHNLREHSQGKMHMWRLKQLFLGNESADIKNAGSLITDQFSRLSIHDKKSHSTTNNPNDSIIPSNVYLQIIKSLKDSPFLPNRKQKNKRFKERSLAERLNKPYSEKYLEIEEQMYRLKTKKFDVLHLKTIMPKNKKSFHCLVCNVDIPKDSLLIYEHVCLQSHMKKSNEIRENVDTEKLIIHYMKEISKDSIKCYACENCVFNKPEIDIHIENRMHTKSIKKFNSIINATYCSIKEELNNLWYSIERFTCAICKSNFQYKLEFIKHILAKHIKSLNKYMFDFCIPCATLWLSETDLYTDHCNDITHKYLIKHKDFMIEDLPECIRQLLKQVDKTADILFKETQVLLDDNVHKEVIQSLEDSLRSCFPSVKAYLFGSRLIGLGFANSDIDIFIDCESTYNKDRTESVKNNYLVRIEQILRKQTDEWEVQEILEEARIPIIKLIYKRGGIPCDISVTNGLSVEKSKLIRSFNEAYPPCKVLILFIKKWVSLFNLPGRHGLSNYALTWLVIFYLQSELYLPSVAELIDERNNSQLICGWETGVAKPKHNAIFVKPISTLLLNFFEFYANFDYKDYIVCPLMGSQVAKKAFAKPGTLPKKMKPYVKHISTSETPEYFRIDSPLCVQDPFDLSQNLTKAVRSITVKCFKQYCRDSASVLRTSKEKFI